MEKTIIKILAICFALLLVFPSACKNDDGSSGSDSPSSEVKPETGYTDLVTSLSKDEYADVKLNSAAYGLSAPENTGVNKDRFENEILYDKLSDGEFSADCIFSLSESDGYAEMKATLASAKEKNEEGKRVKIKFPQKISFDYADANNTGAQIFTIEGFDGLYLEGNDTDVTIVNDGVNFCGLFKFVGCKNIHINDITVDYSNPSVFTGTVQTVNNENKTIEVQILDEFLPMFENKTSVDLKVYTEYGRYSGAPREDGNAFYVDGSGGDIKSAKIDGNMLTITFGSGCTLRDTPRGTLVAMSYIMRKTVMMTFENSENVYVEHVTFYSAAGMGVTSNGCKNLYFNHFREQLKEGTNRLITTTSDGMHLVGTTGDLRITNTLLENNVDDGINVKCGYYMKVLGTDIKTDTVVFQRHYNGILNSNAVPKVGEIIEVYDTLLNPVTELTVESVEVSSGYFKVVVRGNYDDVKAGYYAANVSVSPNFYFGNNIIRNKRNRGALMQVRGGTVENCTFKDVYHGAINLVAEVVSGAWETMMPRDMTVKNCKFLNNNHATGNNGDLYVFTMATGGAASAGAIKEINIENNFFTQSAGAGIAMTSVSDSNIKDNFFYNIATRYYDVSNDCAVLLNNCGEIRLDGNFNSNTNANEDYCGIRIGGATDTDYIYVGKDNTGMTYPKTDDVTTTSVKKLSSAIAIDGNLSDWEGVGTSVDIVGESLADGTVYSGYKSDFEVRTMKIGWTDDGIYLAFDVYDNFIDFRTLDDFYVRDCIEIFATNVYMNNTDIAALKNKGTVFQAGFIDKGFVCTEVRSSKDILDAYKSWEYKMVKRADGYSAEIFMPFKYLGGLADTIKAGESIGLSLVVGDGNREAPTRVRLQVSNAGHFVETNKFNSTSMPKFLFVD